MQVHESKVEKKNLNSFSLYFSQGFFYPLIPGARATKLRKKTIFG